MRRVDGRRAGAGVVVTAGTLWRLYKFLRISPQAAAFLKDFRENFTVLADGLDLLGIEAIQTM